MQSDVNKRRAARRKQIRRKRLKTAFIFFLIIAFITLVIMCFTVFFPIKRINVSGSQIYNKGQIIKASGLSTESNLFVVSEQKIEDKIRKKLPYVDDVKLKRVFPDAVILTVTDAKEYAYFICENNYHVLSDNGYILKKQTEIPENVFEIVSSGISGSVGGLASYKNAAEQELVETLIKSLTQEKIDIEKIDVTNTLGIKIIVNDGFVVELGNREFLNEKIAHLGGMLDSIGDRKGSINLSMYSPNNPQGSFVEEKP